MLVGDPKRAGRPPFCTTGTTRFCDFSLVHSAAAPVPVSLNRHAFFPINQYLRVVALTKLHPIFCVTILLINYAVSVLVSDCSDDSNDADVCSFASRTLIWLRGNFCLSSKPAFNTPIKAHAPIRIFRRFRGQSPRAVERWLTGMANFFLSHCSHLVRLLSLSVEKMAVARDSPSFEVHRAAGPHALRLSRMHTALC